MSGALIYLTVPAPIDRVPFLLPLSQLFTITGSSSEDTLASIFTYHSSLRVLTTSIPSDTLA
jgi:hypothetical protein